jgi:Tfp pilus assembly protein PilF
MRDYVCLGLAMGLALLSMVTVGLLVPPICLALATKLYVERVQLGWQRIAKRVLVSVSVVFGVCGWYYILVWIHSGTPIVADMGVMGSEIFSPVTWWQNPAFRTMSDYLMFGESLRSPLMSVWYSVWDGLYSSLWGDSYCAGVAKIIARPPWSYDFIVAGMALALLPTGAILLAGGAAVLQFLRRPSIIWTFLLAVAYFVAMFLIYGATLLPCYSAVKAFYGLAASVPLCALAAWGLDLLSGDRRWLRGIIFIFMGVWVFNVASSYWISSSAAETRRSLALQLMAGGDEVGATGRLEQLIAEHPDNLSARILLAERYMQQDFNSRVRQILELPPGLHDPSSRRHYMLGILSAREGRPREALDELHMAINVAPNDLYAAASYAITMSSGPDIWAAIAAWRNVLRINPYLSDVHTALARLYPMVGESQSVYRHQEYAMKIDEVYRRNEQAISP